MAFSGGWERRLTAACALLTLAVAQAQTAATPATKATQSTSAGPSQSAASGTTAHKKARKSKRSRKPVSWKKKGQQRIDPERAREIQGALIREHYLDGESNGVWDDASERAMQKYQADNGWQSKMTPDARALIKLGLGPDQKGKLLNPESAMTSGMDAHAASPVRSESIPARSNAPAPTSAPVVAAPTSQESSDPSRQ